MSAWIQTLVEEMLPVPTFQVVTSVHVIQDPMEIHTPVVNTHATLLSVDLIPIVKSSMEIKLPACAIRDTHLTRPT